VPESSCQTFSNPHDHQKAIGAAELLVTGAGQYHANLTCIHLNRLWMQRNYTSLPHIMHSSVTRDRSVIFFLADAEQAPMYHQGTAVAATDLVLTCSGCEHYRRIPAAFSWASMYIRPEDLAAAGYALAGYEVTTPVAGAFLRPPERMMSRLMNLHRAAADLATTTPDILAQPEVAKAFEDELVRTMIGCLTDQHTVVDEAPGHQRTSIMRRLQRVIQEKPGKPLFVTDVCVAVGVSERTLRNHCLEQLGVSPHRYLWLRRMNQTRRALAAAAPTTTTVTRIATEHGFWELGRFSVAYRNLFGESPSCTLHRAA
jgi:AraC-like DNA-binding protein